MKCFAEASPDCKKQGKRLRIRKSASRLSDYETSRLRQALESAIANKTPWMNFPDIANFHGAPFDICTDRKPIYLGCCPHQLDHLQPQQLEDFLPWHRLLLGIMISNLLCWILVSWESEATPSATPFFKRASKLAIFTNYKCPRLICLALPACQKFGLILVIKFF